jgi:hypothetical protein
MDLKSCPTAGTGNGCGLYCQCQPIVVSLLNAELHKSSNVQYPHAVTGMKGYVIPKSGDSLLSLVYPQCHNR